jgi:hypothetical protein
MRQTTEDWLKGKRNPFKFTGSDHSLSGIVNGFHSMMIVPISNRARIDMMTQHGQPYSAEKNEGLMNQVVANPATMYVENLRDILKELDEGELFRYREQYFFDPKLLKVFIKPYTRKMDKLTIWFNKTIMHIVCPEGDWGCFIAPHIVEEDEPKPKTFNPATGVWE